jgi:hypothetical protein
MQNYFDDCLKNFEKPEKWENISYSNDACPSFEYQGYQIFVDHPDPKERELGEDSTRFHITIALDYGDPKWFLDTNNFDEVLKEIEVPYLTRPLTYEMEYYKKEEESRKAHEEKLKNDFNEWRDNLA